MSSRAKILYWTSSFIVREGTKIIRVPIQRKEQKENPTTMNNITVLFGKNSCFVRLLQTPGTNWAKDKWI